MTKNMPGLVLAAVVQEASVETAGCDATQSRDRGSDRKTMLIAGLGMLTGVGTAAMAEQPQPAERDAAPAPLFQLQRRPTPDTSMPGSTGPAIPMPVQRRGHRLEQSYTAELRRCETLGDTRRRLACKDAVREKFADM
jgi:hypothetical protein